MNEGEEVDPHQARKKAWLVEHENKMVVIPVPSLPQEKLKSELETDARKRRMLSHKKKLRD